MSPDDTSALDARALRRPARLAPASWSLPTPRAVAAAAPDLALGATFLLTWLSPLDAPRDLPRTLMLVMLLEFIIIHSSGFMASQMYKPGSTGKRVLGLLGLGAFYTFFVGGFAMMFHSVWPLVTFWILTLNRLLGVLLGQVPSEEQREFIQRNWGVSALFYLGFVFLTVLAPVPRLGLTPDLMSRLELPGSGLWVDQPWRVLACGFLYFTAVGLSELWSHRWPGANDSTRRL